MLFQQVIANLCTLQVFVALIVGVVGGMIVGALPGLSGTMAIALLLPITFSMDAAAGIIMLMAIYTSALTGGSISAILLHTPGTPANAATVIDGYPLTKQGRGLEAVGMAILSSVIGGTLSAIALIIIAPPLAKVSLMFSEPEYFLIAIFGLTIISSLAGDSMIKGLLMGAVGLFLGTVGLDAVSGILRFTYGYDNLMSGISMVPALIGMFSVSQVMVQNQDFRNSNKSILSSYNSELKGKFLPTLREFLHYIPILLRSSIIGIFVGILPGAGGNIGSWVSYNEAKRFSKRKEEFGHGSLEGLCACETGNNAVTGGSFIPMLTLGIPGSPSAAVILGGLMIHGLIPGNRLFTQHANITYTIMAGFLIANFAMGIMGLFIARYVANVVKVPHSILSPIIIILSVLGSYAINGNMFDVYVMLFFALLGYFIIKFGFPSAPLILALILGPMAEGGLIRSIVMARGNVLVYYLSRPICLILLAMIVLSIFAPVISKLVSKSYNKHIKRM